MSAARAVKRRQQLKDPFYLKSILRTYELPQVDYPCFIVCESRSGSTLLCGYFDQLPNVGCEYEILNSGQIPVLNSIRLKRHLYKYMLMSMAAMPEQLRTAMIHFSHLQEKNLSFYDLIKIFPTARFILLYRRSLLDQYVSLKLAEKTGRYIAFSKKEETKESIEIDVNDFVHYANKLKANYNETVNNPILKGRLLIVSYEDLVMQRDRVMQEFICPFLGVQSVKLSTKMRKQNQLPIDKAIRNYEDLNDTLQTGIAFIDYPLGKI